MPAPIPMSFVYAGLVGLGLALLVATAQQKWKPKVFFLLALRLAIGWQFLFEGLNKIHSHYVGPSETNKPFTSEPYFKEAPGPLAPYMRAMNGDATKAITEGLTVKPNVSATEFARLPEAEQAAHCPESIAKKLDAMLAAATSAQREAAEAALAQLAANHDKAIQAIAATEKKETEAAKDDAGKTAAKQKAESARTAAEQARDKAKAEEERRRDGPDAFATAAIQTAKAEYARWAYGVDRREIKLARISGEPAFTGPQRLQFLALLRKAKDDAEERHRLGLGNGYGIDVKKTQAARAEYWSAEADLAKEIDTFVGELRTRLNGGKAPETPVEVTPLQRNDQLTRWFLAIVGACILFGLFTRISCVLAAGFLLLTYLTHPPFPWFTLPPGTEGNPLFINKNAIEFLALLALACMPTGKWLGLDAMIAYLFRGKPKEASETTKA
ncbi:MAG: hypothetical protein JNK93_12220 [Planctomycetia bacterium]|nr:hypothetical protein [Planctomycetia bacterium]